MNDTVLVTGVSGYVGQHWAAELLRQGFRVHGSLRNPHAADAVRRGIAGVAPVDDLDFVELDLLADAGWDAAMAGCRYALHVASPYFPTEPRQASTYIEPAVQGTRRALAAARKAGVERVVVTSSVVAMNGHMINGTFGPSDWTDLDAPNLNAYIQSKTLAERAAWDFAREHPGGPEVVAINPGATYGPTLTGDASGQSLKWVAAILRGRVPLFAQAYFTMVDVRGLVKYLGKRVGADNAATLRDLDWTPIPFDETVLDTAASLKSVVEA